MRDKLVDRTATYRLGKVLKLDRWVQRMLHPIGIDGVFFRSPMEKQIKENQEMSVNVNEYLSRVLARPQKILCNRQHMTV